MGTRRSRKRFDSLLAAPPFAYKKLDSSSAPNKKRKAGVDGGGTEKGVGGTVSTQEEVTGIKTGTNHGEAGPNECRNGEQWAEEGGVHRQGFGVDRDGGVVKIIGLEEQAEEDDLGQDEISGSMEVEKTGFSEEEESEETGEGEDDAYDGHEVNAGNTGEGDALEESHEGVGDPGGDGCGDLTEVESEGILNIRPLIIWALLQTGGSRRVTVEQYQSIRTMITKILPGNAAVHRRALPHYRTLMRTYKPIIMEQLAVKAQFIASDINTGKRGARPCLMRKNSRFGRISYVPVREYAIADFCNPFFLQRLKGSMQGDIVSRGGHDMTFGDTNPIVQAREWFYGPPRFVDVEPGEEGNNYAEAGDLINIRIIGVIDFASKSWKSFKGASARYCSGILSTVFLCKNKGEENDEEVIEGDARTTVLKRVLSTLTYRWPMESPLVIRTRRAPLVQPTDIVGIVRPPSEEDGDRLIMVFRYVKREGERAKFLFIIRGSTDLSGFEAGAKSAEGIREYSECIFEQYKGSPPNEGFDSQKADIREIRIGRVHEGKRGPYKFEACRPLGTLENGEKYGVYRFSLYLDGFRASQFAASSYEGVYIQPVSVAAACRSDSATARVLTIIPPGMKKGPILRRIIDDIVEEMKTGVVIYDADGTKRRLFLDLVNILGDTPGLNAFLDFGGHSGNEFCHRCRVSKTMSGPLTNRCLQKGADWLKASMRRTSDRTHSLRISGAPKGVLEVLGIPWKETTDRETFRYFETRIRGTSGSVPRTEAGLQVASSFFESFAACTICPDHLFMGHFRDLFNVALKLLRNEERRVLFESIVIRQLRERNLWTQSRIYDRKNNVMFGMTISQCYALAPFVPDAFKTVLGMVPTQGPLGVIELKVHDAISSSAALCGVIWAKNSIGESGRKERVRAMGAEHFRNLHALCEVSDEMEEACMEGNGDVKGTKDMCAEFRTIYEVNKMMGKPNTHRLLELFIEQFLFWNQAVWASELSLERTHQRVKAAIKKSNGKEEQVLAVNGLRFNDWQGRVGAIIKREGGAVLFHLREALRLSVGKSILQMRIGSITQEFKTKVRNLFNPEGVVMAELGIQGQSVFGKHSAKCCGVRTRTFEVAGGAAVISPHNRFDFAENLTEVTGVLGIVYEHRAQFCMRVTLQCQCSRQGQLVTAGDIIQESEESEMGRRSTYYCILFFFIEGDAVRPTHAIATECSEIQGSTLGSRVSVNSPRSYKKIELSSATKFIAGSPDCQGMGCEKRSGGVGLKHKTTGGRKLVIKLDAMKGFPPRQG